METASCKIPVVFQGQEGENQVKPLRCGEAVVKEDLGFRKGNLGLGEDGGSPPNKKTLFWGFWTAPRWIPGSHQRQKMKFKMR